MSVFDIVEVAAKTAKPTVIRSAIRTLLLANGGAAYKVIEGPLMPPGKTGSRSFDQMLAIVLLLEADADHDGTINTIMKETELSHRMLWDHLYAVLRLIGFKMSHGRLVGLLEDKSKQNGDDQGQPDID